MSNELLERLGIELPIIQAPMAGSQGSALAIAVSNAGGLGSLPCAMLGVDAMSKEIAAIRAATQGPFAVNFFCHKPPRDDAERDAAWRTLLKPYYRDFRVDPNSIPRGAPRRPFDIEYADVLAKFAPPVVTFHFGLPSPELVDQVRAWGAFVMSSATTVDEALWLEERGVDAVIAQGAEAGGHRGMFLTTDVATQVGTFALLPQIVRAVKVPVIAAGGIADARGVRAVLSLGASAAQVGTAYLLCPEATTGAVHRAALAGSASRVTALTNVFTGRPARGIVNRLMREMGPINATAPEFPLAAAAVAPLRAKAEALGSGDFSPLWSGQNATGCKPIPAAELTRELAAFP
ncbi:MAG TPA: nitronate monooxygenase [Pseudomonadales bacterium]